MFIERDQKNAKMQAELFNRMSEIINSVDPLPKSNDESKFNNVQFVDMESAIKELLAMGVK